MSATPCSIDQILKRRRIIITCGTGGVGKTTLSAALAMRAALLGKRAIVITIDPAKRLATSLGIDHLGNRPHELTHHLEEALAAAKAAGRPAPEGLASPLGRIYAVVPDASRNFHDFLEDLAPSKELVERIMRNPIFQIFTKEFSGANEYMALERLQALDRTGNYDCIILDTPPSRNALAFLEAPRLLARFFEERLIRWLVLPSNKLVAEGMKKALGVLERLTGSGFMTALFEFASSLFEVRVRFMANMEQTTRLLESPQVGFVVVTTPTPETGGEIRHFIETLKKHRFHFDGVAVNRSLEYLEWERQPAGKAPQDASADKEAPKLTPKGTSAKDRAAEILEALRKREMRAIDQLRRNGASVCARLPELARDVHSVEDLYYVALAFDPRSRG